jgi:putative membrane-bound dehydrogenase-like protein
VKYSRSTASWFAILAALSCAASSPLSPVDELKTFQLADPNLTVELVAAEPDVRAPVAIAWDADGRMFVAEMTDYPSGPVNGRIRLLEDRNGDGRYEHAIIFATNLAFPNGVMAWKNGVLITAAPDILFLADTNGDGRADVRERILTGFSEGNQQLRVNGLFWGIDNWIYGANGRSDGEVKWGDGTPAGSIRRKDFRFRPDTKQFEVIAGNSQFGMGHDDWGNRFPVFNATPIRHVVMEDRYLSRQPLLAGTDNVPGVSPADGTRVFALTPPTLLIPQPIGHFTSACGPSVYRGTALPEEYRGNYFVCEPVQNVVQRRVLKPNGSTFVAEYAHTSKEFLASTDRWFHGVFTATGPDGALYVVDFYRDLVEHPQWVAPELRDKVDWRKGEEHGRIWRVRAKGAKAAKVEKLSGFSNLQLVKALESDNGWTRDTAHRLLVERDAREITDALNRLVRQSAKPQSRLHAIHLLARLNARNGETYAIALRDKHPAVRAHAIDLLASDAAKMIKLDSSRAVLKRLTAMADDADARVRLQLACSLGSFAGETSHLGALVKLANNPELDQWQALGISSSAGARPWMLQKEVWPLYRDPTAAQLGLLEQLSKLVAAKTNSADENTLYWWLTMSDTPNRFALLAAALDASTPARAREIAAVLTNQISAPLANRSLPEKLRVAAIHVAALGKANPDMFVPLLTADEPDAVQVAAAKALFESNEAGAAMRVFTRWNECSKTARRQMIPASMRHGGSAFALLEAIETGIVPLIELDAATRQTLEKSSNAELKQRAVKLFAATISADRDAIVQKYRPALKLAADHKRGAALFEKNCVVCHRMQGVGANVGPDLSGTGQQPRETLLVQILDPSRQVLPDFVAYSAETKGGESYTGFIANESPATVTLRRANEPDITLKRFDLKELKTSGKSLMPDGLEAGMSDQDMADLIEFLRRPDRTLFSQSK